MKGGEIQSNGYDYSSQPGFLTVVRTWWPFSSSVLTKQEAMKPVPPVTQYSGISTDWVWVDGGWWMVGCVQGKSLYSGRSWGYCSCVGHLLLWYCWTHLLKWKMTHPFCKVGVFKNKHKLCFLWFIIFLPFVLRVCSTCSAACVLKWCGQNKHNIQ